jgi:hypothetical protein
MECVSETLHVHVTGEGLDGDYVVEDLGADGTIVLVPEHSAAESRRRHGLRPATLAEFEAQYGKVAPPDGEG